MADGVGSSPRMRGKLRVHNSYNSHERLIPAHAGKTEPCSRPSRHLRAHPRACGENLFAFANKPFVTGSSPRMRGKRSLQIWRDMFKGLIPAHAGKTYGQRRIRDSLPAHPRACGENLARLWLAHSEAGSSPRMRGKLQEPLLIPTLGRLIPAHAGKTSTKQPCSLSRSAHPRACGENPWKAARPCPPPWLIPAHAGKTP